MRNPKFQVLALAIASLTIYAPALAGPGDPKPVKKMKYIDPANMDKTVKPGDNFYRFANGNWLKNNPVPPSKTRWGSFDELREESSKRMRGLLEEASVKASSDPRMQQIGDFYASGMDSAKIEQLGYQPIKADLDKIAAIKSIPEMLNMMASQRVEAGPSYFIGMFVSQDRKNVTQYIPSVGQGGTSLPDRDYYLKNDGRSTTIRKAYNGHMINMFKLIGNSEADASRKADAVMRIETAMAKAQMSRVEMRDPYRTYNKFAWKDLTATTPSIDWKQLAETMQIRNVDSVLVSNPSYLKTLDLLLSAVSLDDWKAYMQWHYLRQAAPYLSSAFVDESFNLTKVLTGQKEQTPRWQRISALIDGQMGDALGQLYVAKYFKPEAKERMMELVSNLQATFNDRLGRLAWMSADTKKRANEKLNAFGKKIGYPDKWKDYSSIKIDRNDFIGNVRRASKWSYNEMVNRLGKPIDKTIWGMTPPTINAYYNAVNNEIAFPAGILQFPFFDFGADDAVNYGGIGAVIGHEMTHGFDDQGSKYAADGNLKDWWTKEDADKFKKLADEVVSQYNGYTVLDTVHLNGKLTLGENIADLGGLAMAYEAFTKTKQFKEGKKIDGFTPAQRFFLGWAQVWRNNALPETQAQLILTDTHSPGEHRANGPITNMEEWYQAFGVKEGDKMYKKPEVRTRIW